MTLPLDDHLSLHCRMMIDRFAQGDVIPFLGAGASLANRPSHASFILGQYLPNAAELSENIAECFNYPWADTNNLSRVSWYAASTVGEDRLYQHLHGIFSQDYPLPDLHKFFARLPRRLAAKGYPNRYQLIITTNYDALLERAFEDEGEEYDVLSYLAHSDRGDSRQVGKFRYLPHCGEPQIVFDPSSFNLSFERTVIFKVHGAVDRTNWQSSSFVVTEEDYIAYLATMNTAGYDVPAVLMERMIHRSFLFLGYSLGDWDMRAQLKRIDNSWAILSQTKESDEFLWQNYSVRLMKFPLSDYVAALDRQLDALPAISGGV